MALGEDAYLVQDNFFTSVPNRQDIWSVTTNYEVSIESFEQSIGGNLSRLAPDLGGNLTKVNVLEHLKHRRLMILIEPQSAKTTSYQEHDKDRNVTQYSIIEALKNN